MSPGIEREDVPPRGGPAAAADVPRLHLTTEFCLARYSKLGLRHLVLDVGEKVDVRFEEVNTRLEEVDIRLEEVLHEQVTLVSQVSGSFSHCSTADDLVSCTWSTWQFIGALFCSRQINIARVINVSEFQDSNTFIYDNLD